MKLPNHRDRETKDHNISKERQRTINRATDSLIFAMPVFYRLVVEERYWLADCEIDEEGGDAPADGVGEVGPGEHSELFGGEETHVEE